MSIEHSWHTEWTTPDGTKWRRNGEGWFRWESAQAAPRFTVRLTADYTGRALLLFSGITRKAEGLNENR
jgi:hypothetical protein